MVLPSYDEASKVPQPGEQSFDLPASTIAAQRASVLLGYFPVGIADVGGDQFDASLGFQLGVEGIGVVGLVADDAFWRVVDDAGVESLLNEGYFVRRSARRANGERKTRAVCNGHDLCAFAPTGLSHVAPPFLAGANVPSMKDSSMSMPPRSRRSLAMVRRMPSSVPSRAHWAKRRWQVWYDGYLSGISFHCAPVRIIHKMPFIIRRSSILGRPRPSARFGGLGINGSITNHCSSVRSIGSSPFGFRATVYHF